MSSKCSFKISQKLPTYFIVFVTYSVLCPLIISTHSQSYEIPVCCPPGWVLVKINTGIFAPKEYECIKREVAEKFNSNWSIFENITETNGFRIRQLNETDANSSIPKCDMQALTIFSGETEIEFTPHSCVIQVLNTLLMVSCPQQDEEQMQLLSVVHKCCPVNYIYSFSKRKCLINKSKLFDFDEYNILFDHPVLFVDNALDCPINKVLVEYTLSSSDIMFSDGYLIIKKLNFKFHLGEYCIEAIREHEVNADFLTSTNLKFLVRICTDYEICERMPCIRRCCLDGEIFSKGNATSYCQKDNSDVSFHSFESLMISGNFSKPSVFGILRSLDCRKFRLDPDSYSDEAHTISDRDGSLYVMTTQRNYTNNQYCVEKIRNSSWEDQKLYTFLCFDSKVVGNDKIRFKLYPIGVLISCSFYALTLAVYLSIPKLRNLPGKILICLVSSLFAAYLSIALGQLMPTSNDDICFISGFFVYFCLMAAFAWMNVMCFDIWQTFGTAKRKHGFKSDQTKRFVLYSMYGWGLPTLLTVTTVSLTKSNLLSESIKPHFGHGRCWFAYDTLASANLLFFSGPVGLLFIINFILFSITLRYCNKVKREIFRMQSSNMEKPALRKRFFMDKARFAMNTKLFIVMGITWLLEILSILFYDHKKTFFWAISDSFNVLLGVFVFFIFVFKKRVWYAILERFGLKSRNNQKSTPTATFATHSTYAQSVSMTRLNATDSNSTLLSPTTAAQRLPSRSPSM